MNKTVIATQIVLLLSITNILSTEQYKSNKRELIKKSTIVDVKKYEPFAENLLNEFLLSKNIKQQDIPSAMKNELNSKKHVLIQKLASLNATEVIDNKNQDLVCTIKSLFDDFAQRIKYVKLSMQNQELVDAIKEAKTKSHNTINCSYPDISKDKRHLLDIKSE